MFIFYNREACTSMCEFDIYRIKENLNKCCNISIFIFFFNIMFLSIDILIGLFFDFTFEPNYVLASFYTILVIILIIWTFAYKKICSNISNFNILRASYLLFTILIYLWGMSISLMLILFTDQISSYIIITLALNTLIQLSKKDLLTVLIPYNLLFIGILSFILLDNQFLYDNILSIFFTNIVGYILTSSQYKYSKAYYLSNVQLSNSKYALEKANEELMRYDQNRTKLFTNISHELKTPINVIYGAHQLLDIQFNNDIQDIKKCKTYNSMIKQNSFRLIRLINNILDISKIDDTVYEIKKENIDIVESVENMVSSVSEFVQKKEINIIFDTDVEEKIIAVDPDKLERIILNLISNAIKFTDGGGTIFITIYTKPKAVYISVKDTGIGIDEEYQKVIFDRFAQIDDSLSRNAEGTGIGLALVKSLMLLHDGDVTLTSSPGNGSDFTLCFPNRRLDFDNSSCEKTEYKKKAYKNKIERIEIEFSDIYK